jgi:hygromycin-B 4-O-kinase
VIAALNMPTAEAELFLKNHYGSRAGELAPLANGEWSQAYTFKLDGGECVIRFGQHGEDFAKDETMSRFLCPSLPIPRVLEVGKAATGFFSVSQRAYGVVLDDLDFSGMTAALPSLLRSLDACGRIDLSRSHGYGVWKPDGIAPYDSWPEALLAVAEDNDRLVGWRSRLKTFPAAYASFQAGYERLSELVEGLPQPRQIIHGDLLHNNVLVQGDRISAVLDWGNSLYGDALYDAAWLLYWWPWYPAWAGIDIRHELNHTIVGRDSSG